MSEVRPEIHYTAVPPPAGRVRRVAFYAVAVLFSLMILFMSPLPYAALGWFLEETVTHRIHETAFGFIFALSLAGVLAQLRNPTFKIAQMWQAAIPIWLTILAIIFIGEPLDPTILLFLVIPALLVALHPGRSLLLRPPTEPSRILAVLTLVGAVPFLIFGIGEFRIGQDAAAIAGDVVEKLPDDISVEEAERRLRAVADTPEEEEAAVHLGHWPAMAAFGVALVALAGLASLRVPGWRLPAWGSGIASIAYGLASLFAPDDSSAAIAVWAVLAILWGLALIVAAEYEVRRATPGAPATAPPQD